MLPRALWLLCSVAFAQTPVFRLPDSVVPTRHTLELTIDPRQPNYQGRAVIEADARQPVTTLWINSRQLLIRSARVEQNGSQLVSKVLTAAGEFTGLQLERPISGPLQLQFEFQARLDDKRTSGAYRRSIAGDNYVFTTFTPIEARQAFPCFDEPRFKTPWQISLRVRNEDQAFANAAAVEETAEPNGWKLIRFAQTPPLPAELVAFAVGPFDVYTGEPVGGAKAVRVITAKGRSAEGHAAALATQAVLPRLEEYTGVPYLWGKLDHIALPDGQFSAVENPGLITYVAEELLAPPDEETPERTRLIRELQIHELAHQWFGNLVTQADWDDVWLSEGIATYLERKLMDVEEPARRARLRAVRARQRIMTFDESKASRPVRRAIATVEDSMTIYNRMVYDKGAAILLTLEGWLGEDTVRQGLQRFLREHWFANATTDDLASTLPPDARAVIHALADSTGVPQVEMALRCTRGQGKLRLTQKSVPTLPVCWRTSTGAQGCALLGNGAAQVDLPHCPAWVLPNAGGYGYFRTSWTNNQLKTLRMGDLSAAERLTLTYDLRGPKPAKNATKLLKTLAADAEPEIAAAAKDALKKETPGAN